MFSKIISRQLIFSFCSNADMKLFTKSPPELSTPLAHGFPTQLANPCGFHYAIFTRVLLASVSSTTSLYFMVLPMGIVLQFLNIKQFIFKIKTDKQTSGKNRSLPPKKGYCKMSERLFDT